MNTNSTEHTKTPWEYIPTLAGNFVILAGEGGVAKVFRLQSDGGNRDAETEANAAFIVKAVNSHEALVEALENALAAIQEAQPEAARLNRAAGETVFNPTVYKMLDVAQHKAREALRLATQPA